jgi:hypothetical protein
MTEPGRTCKCGCGTLVAGKAAWVRGHSARGAGRYSGPQPIPGPDDPDLYDDIGELVPDDADSDATPTAPGAARPAEAVIPPMGQAGPVPPDRPPLHGTRDWRRTPRQAKARPVKLTASVHADINAKISFALEIPGRVWQARDPVCGGTFVQQRGEISVALTEIVCQSADLVAWFSGSGGQFMLWLNLAAACWPVATVIMAHHVYHSLEAGEADAEPDMTRYAA